MNDERKPPVHDDPTDADVQNDEIIGIALRWSLVVIAIVAIVGAGVIFWLTRPEPPTPIQETELAKVNVRQQTPLRIPQLPFVDITSQAGIQFVHENGAYGQKLLPETMGSGCAFLDYDQDGDMDLLLVNATRWPWDNRPANEKPQHLRLYQNDGTGQFRDVTADSGLAVSLYGMGVAVGDYDNDGRVDIFLSAVGPNRLFHNEGDGTFSDQTMAAGVAGQADQWSSSCGWFDYDRDGDLDLFVCNYLKWSREYDESQNFRLTGGGRAYGRPQNFEGTFPYLYRNDGAGKFTDVSAAAGVQIRNPNTQVPLAKSLGLTFADFDQDSWIDIIVANDTVQNLLFRNQGDGTFQEMGVLAGVAFDSNGQARGAMGIDIGHFRNNDSLGIAIGNFSNEMTALYVSTAGQMQFVDEAISSGLGPKTRLELTFGVTYFDADLDGRLDLIAANGHLEEDINRVQASQHYEQPPQLFWNCGLEQDTEFVGLAAEHCGQDLLRPMVGRGVSYADIDQDGDLDLLLTATGQAPRLLRNDQAVGNHWIRLVLVGTSCNRDAIGAEVEVHAGDLVLRRQVMPTRSYLSQVELPLTFGLGQNTKVGKILVRWPDGTRQELEGLAIDTTHTVQQTELEKGAGL